MQVDKGDLKADYQDTPGHWTWTERISFLTTVTPRFSGFRSVAELLFFSNWCWSSHQTISLKSRNRTVSRRELLHFATRYSESALRVPQ